MKRESGSLPLTMLAAIVVGGLVVALFSQVVVNQRQTRVDRDFHGAIHAADTGLQSAYLELAANPPSGATVQTSGSGQVRNGQDLAAYEWQARRGLDGRWEVRVLGQHSSGERVLEARVGERQLFPVALFGDEGVRVTGGGGAGWEVYDATGYVPSMPVTIGTNNGAPDLPGNHTGVNPVCYGLTPCANRLSTESLYFQDHAWDAYNEEDGECYGVTTPLPVNVDENSTFQFDRADSPYCVSEVIINRSATVEVVGAGSEGVEVYIQPGGKLSVDGAGQGSNLTLVNVTEAQLTDPIANGYPDSTQLQFFVSGGLVDFSNNSLRIAASVYAPRSFCDFTAQATMFGGAICGEVDAVGGFEFAYDLRLAELTDDTYDILGWREETRNRGSFSWSSQWP